MFSDRQGKSKRQQVLPPDQQCWRHRERKGEHVQGKNNEWIHFNASGVGWNEIWENGKSFFFLGYSWNLTRNNKWAGLVLSVCVVYSSSFNSLDFGAITNSTFKMKGPAPHQHCTPQALAATTDCRKDPAIWRPLTQQDVLNPQTRPPETGPTLPWLLGRNCQVSSMW